MAVNERDDAVVYTLDLPRSAIENALMPTHRDEVRYADKAESGERYRGTEAENELSRKHPSFSDPTRITGTTLAALRV